MEPQTNPSTNLGRASAKDFFINLGAIVALYTLVYSLINLLFTVINKAYPQITNGYDYYGSQSISWPVATLIIFFPIFIFLMWLLEKEYGVFPEKQNFGIHKWLTYITLFVAGVIIAGDLITVLYYFIDGQELTTGFLLKILVLFVVASSIFMYYISDIRGKLTPQSRKIWRVVAGVIIFGSIIWGFSVLGSPRTQRLFKYDQQKVNDLQQINNAITSQYELKGTLPNNLAELFVTQSYIPQTDQQTQKSYEYEKVSNTAYKLCAEFNKALTNNGYYANPREFGGMWIHPAGRHCFEQTVNPNMYSKPVPLRY